MTAPRRPGGVPETRLAGSAPDGRLAGSAPDGCLAGSAPDGRLASAVLTIDLDAVVANWRALGERVAPAECAAVVKADAYGLGAARVVPALAGVGCRTFFVATPGEGVAVRALLEAAGAAGAVLYVLNGAPPGAEAVFAGHRLRPVLNSRAAVDAWAAYARTVTTGSPPAAALHIDTGMARLGLPADELAALAADPSPLAAFPLAAVMSHFACADTPTHPLNARQREAFFAAARRLPQAPTSLANSAGIFLGAGCHGDLVRPGIALYGGAPVAGAANPMRPVVRLDATILQVREIDTNSTVGYGASFTARHPKRIATVAVGYADGFLRSLSNAGFAVIGGRVVPLVGRVSMDLITLDVTDVPAAACAPGRTVQLLGPDRPIDAVAAEAGTIGYEILTSLGARYHRVYTPAR